MSWLSFQRKYFNNNFSICSIVCICYDILIMQLMSSCIHIQLHNQQTCQDSWTGLLTIVTSDVMEQRTTQQNV